EYAGRIDHQVKMRGYRIELAEIETVLAAHTGVEHCAVRMWENEAGNQHLVAYIVPSNGCAPVDRDLREYLLRKLPEYMVPWAFVELAQLPLTANGKLDRKALPAHESAMRETGEKRERTPIEEIVAGDWAEVLKGESPGTHWNFSELGGHSLLATQIISRLKSVFAIDLPLRALFENPTVSGLSAAIERLSRTDLPVEPTPLRGVSRDQELPLSFAQQGLWFIHQLDSDNPVYNVQRVLRLRGAFDLMTLSQCFQEIVCRHEVLRTRFEARDGRPVQIIENSCQVEVKLWNLIEVEESQREEMAREISRQDALRAFDLKRGPLWR